VQGLAEGAHVQWEVELLDFERQVGFCFTCFYLALLTGTVLCKSVVERYMLLQAHATHLSSDELLQRGTLLRTQGNVVFKQVIKPLTFALQLPLHSTGR
jgi:hypothetical protein